MGVLGYAKFCSVFAVFGFTFLIIVGVMLQKQPLYIRGPEDKEAAASSCYSAAAIYFAVWVASLGYWSYDSYKSAREDGGSMGADSKSYGGRAYGAIGSNSN